MTPHAFIPTLSRPIFTRTISRPLPPRKPTLTLRRFRAPQSTASPSPSVPLPDRKPVPLTLLGHQIHLPGRLLLSLVPILWASFVPIAKLVYILPRTLSPSTFNALRLLVSALLFLPFLTPRHGRTHIRPGIELGTLIFLANTAQILGLRYTDASRAAFLNQLSTVFVPLIAAAVGFEKLSARVFAGAALAVVGVGLLTLGGAAATGAAATRLVGDAFEVLSAVFGATYVIRVSHYARSFAANSMPMVAVKVVTQAALSAVWLGMGVLVRHLSGVKAAAVAATVSATPWTVGAVVLNLAFVVWGGMFVSAASSWLQMKGQSAVPASETAVLFALQPVWASVMAMMVLGERLGGGGMVGAGLVVCGALVSSGVGKKKVRDG